MRRFEAVLAVALVAACGGGGASSGGGGGTVQAGDPLVESVLVSDAVVGGKGRLLVTLRNTVGKDVDVTLTAGGSGAATFPATVKVLAGSKIGEAEYDGAAVGNFSVAASVNGTSLFTTGNVVSALRLSNVSGSTRLQKGAGGLLTVSLNMTVPHDTEVALLSTSPDVVAAPTKISIPAFRSFFQLGVVGAAVGSTTLSATLMGQSVSQVFYVTDTVSVSFVQTTPSRAVKGTTGVLTVGLNAVPAKDAQVTLESTKPDVAAVPGSITIPAGSSSLSVPFTASMAGTAVLKATFAGSTRLTTQVVVDKNGLRSFSCPAKLAVGTTAECGLNLDATSTGDTVVALASSTAGVLSLPATVTVPAGLDGLSFAVAGLVEGATSVSATVDTSVRSASVVVAGSSSAPAGLLSYFYGSPGSGPVGGSTYLYGGLDAPVAADTVVTLTSSNPAVAAPQSSVTITTGGSSFQVPITFLASGYTLITATINGVKNYAPLSASNGGGVNVYSYLPTPSEVGVLSSVYVQLNSASSTDLPITATFGTAGVVDMPAASTLKAGVTYLQIPIRATAAGTTTIKVSVAGQVFGLTATVVATAKVNSISFGTIGVSTPGTVNVNMDATVAKDVTLTLAQTGTGVIAMLPTTLLVRTGSSSATVSLLGMTQGAVTVTVTQGATMVTGSTTIVP